MLNWFRSIMNSGSVLGYFFQAVPITCFVGIVYLIIRVVTVKRNKLKVEWLKEIMKLLFTHTAIIIGGGERNTRKAPLNHNGSEVFLRLRALLLYRDFLPVLEEKDHLVIEDRDPAEMPLDVALPSNYINGGDSIRN